MKVAVAMIRLRIHEVRSLKERRSIINKIRDRVLNRFKIALAEISDDEKLNFAGIGISAVGNDGRVLDQVIDSVIHFIEGLFLAEIIGVDREILSFKEWSSWKQVLD